MSHVEQAHPLTEYDDLPIAEVFDRTRHCKEQLGPRLVILGHHYQADEVLQFAHFVGDSLKLAQQAALQEHAEYVVFCGVHFMAESADIVTKPDVQVMLPHLEAGCSMADMASIDQVEAAWPFLTAAAGDARIIPVTYVNSTAPIKAFCGRNGGLCCTSSNAPGVVDWAMSQGEKILFLPDQHLGRNTLCQLGCPMDSIVLYDPAKPHGGLTAKEVAGVKAVLWQGCCDVHMKFSLDQCRRIREQDPACRIIVHPECTWEVFQEADMAGSTEFIIRAIDEAPDGSRWAIGTETHLVDRLAKRHAGRLSVRNLATERSDCPTMALIDPKHLLWVLENLADGHVVNRITVDESIRDDANLALERMLALKPGKPVKG
ncbi:MAG: quinolinate synthase NadA [Phycisphaerae bacterium]|nr:quinolinate synthase NadA [Phycisphaerae bacterium]